MRSIMVMFDSLNRMLEQRQVGEPIDPSFEEFMERFGDFFPGNPTTLDELLEQMAQQMAQKHNVKSGDAMANDMSGQPNGHREQQH